MKEEIVELLSSGIPASAVASALGVSPSLVSQVLDEEGIAQEVATQRAAKFHQFAEHDKRLHAVEAKALQKLERVLDFSTKPGEVAKIFSILNSARRVTTDQGIPQQNPTTTVVISLPESARVDFTLTTEKQVIEIEGRSMAPLPAKNVTQLLQTRRLLDTKVPATLLEKSL